MEPNSGLPALILTGASGLLGKYLLDEFKNDFRIFAIARRSQHECNAPKHPNIAWMRADIADRKSISRAFREIDTAGGADFLIHLAAYYDFANDNHPEYYRTNVEGTRNILKLATELNLKLFVFASSVAACSFPLNSNYVDENSPPDGSHIYARSKKAGEELVKEFSNYMPTCIVRFGAIFSDWCEYAPLFLQINTWTGKSMKSRIIGGKGESAIPYIHVKDVLFFIRKLLIHSGNVNKGIILVASTNDSISHLQLYKLTTRYYFGKERKALRIPKLICAAGIYFLTFLKWFSKTKLFERPWMVKFIDKKLNIKLTKTPELIKWNPNPRLQIEKRLPFLIERMKSEPISWQMRNTLILRKTEARVEFIIYSILIDVEELVIENILENINREFKDKPDSIFTKIENSEIKWFLKLIYRLLVTSIDTNNRILIQSYFEVSAIHRFQLKYGLEEIRFLLKNIQQEVIKELVKNKHLSKNDFYNYITIPIEFAIDEIEQQYDLFLQNVNVDVTTETFEEIKPDVKSARELLEETIWSCLVNRK